ncbi:sugar-binding transcriptional regulator [Enterococcus sp. UD-01]|jgi:DNA-binding transcriptional regulator LsrR (DeoR family)|uniref:sugar-binding transcriptional regulator n=1 Tax=Enterococcus sp. UD-01 TaxID=3373911 RepID=UPI0038343CA9
MDQLEEKEFVRVATMYYEEGMTQAEIAKKIGVSRSLISKILLDAKKSGIVEIFINSKSAYTVNLERKLERKYDLKRVIIVDTSEVENNEISKTISREAALYLKEISKNTSSIGISWGESLRGLVSHYPYTNQSDITVFPLIGGMGDDYIDIHSNQLCYDLARKMRAKAKYLYAPALVSNERIKKELKDNPTIHAVFEESKTVDIALVGISSPFKESTMVKIGYLNQDDLSEIKANHVIGDINSRFFDATGEEADCMINRNVLGINLKEIQQIPTVMTIAYGDEKFNAIQVAVTKKLINVLITTDTIAMKLLEE